MDIACLCTSLNTQCRKSLDTSGGTFIMYKTDNKLVHTSRTQHGDPGTRCTRGRQHATADMLQPLRWRTCHNNHVTSTERCYSYHVTSRERCHSSCVTSTEMPQQSCRSTVMPQQSCNRHWCHSSHVSILKSSRLGNTEPRTDKPRGETNFLEWIRPCCFSTWDAILPLHLSLGFRGLYQLLIFYRRKIISRHTDSSCSWGHWRVHTCDNRHTPHSRRHAHESCTWATQSQKHHTRAGGEHGVTLINTLHVLFWYPEDTKLWAFSALYSWFWKCCSPPPWNLLMTETM